MNTNRILATLGVVLVLLTASVVVAIRVFAAPAREDGGTVFERELDVERFAGMELLGVWEPQFARGDEYSAVLTGDPELVDTAEVSTAGEEDRTVRIMISAPTIEALAVAGAANGRIVGLDAPELTVVCEGAANLVFEESSIGDLTLRTEGAVNIDLGASLVENAVLDMSGASQLVINMNGGSLTGSVQGVGNVRYSGEVSTVDLDMDAVVRIRRT